MAMRCSWNYSKRCNVTYKSWSNSSPEAVLHPLSHLYLMYVLRTSCCNDTGIIMGIGLANESRRYKITSYLIDQAPTQNDPCTWEMYPLLLSYGLMYHTCITKLSWWRHQLETLVTGPLCGEFTGPGEIPTQRPVTRSFDVFFDLGLNKRLTKQPWVWWFETPAWSLWRQCNVMCNPLTS